MTFTKAVDVAQDALIVGGVAISITMIYQILGIVILAFQIVLIIVKASIRLYNLIKNKKLKEAVEVIEETKTELENMKERTDGKQQH